MRYAYAATYHDGSGHSRGSVPGTSRGIATTRDGAAALARDYSRTAPVRVRRVRVTAAEWAAIVAREDAAY